MINTETRENTETNDRTISRYQGVFQRLGKVLTRERGRTSTRVASWLNLCRSLPPIWSIVGGFRRDRGPRHATKDAGGWKNNNEVFGRLFVRRNSRCSFLCKWTHLYSVVRLIRPWSIFHTPPCLPLREVLSRSSCDTWNTRMRIIGNKIIFNIFVRIRGRSEPTPLAFDVYAMRRGELLVCICELRQERWRYPSLPRVKFPRKFQFSRIIIRKCWNSARRCLSLEVCRLG